MMGTSSFRAFVLICGVVIGILPTALIVAEEEEPMPDMHYKREFAGQNYRRFSRLNIGTIGISGTTPVACQTWNLNQQNPAGDVVPGGFHHNSLLQLEADSLRRHLEKHGATLVKYAWKYALLHTHRREAQASRSESPQLL